MKEDNDKPTPVYPEVLILTGAGISIPIGIPAMHGMFSAFTSQKKPDITPAIKKTCKFMTDELGIPHDLEEFLVAANSITEFKTSSLSPLVEKSISPTKGSTNITNYRKRLSKYRSDAENVKLSILNFMAQKCFQFERSKAESYFKGLVTSISKKGYPVYTTNYDFAFEYVAQVNKITIHDNFNTQGQRQIWDNNIKFRYGKGFTIIKLHGSVSWYKNEAGDIEKIYYPTDTNPMGEKISRIVITPTRFKDIYDQNFFALYSHFLSNLSMARVLIVAGHSLRDDYLRAAIVERSRKGSFHLIVIDPHYPKELKEELQPARKGNAGSVTHVPLKLEEFSDELGNILQHSEAEHIASKCAEIVHHINSKTNKISLKGRIGTLKSGGQKSFTVKVSTYIKAKDRPARIRVWLSALDQVSREFIETESLHVATDLTGMIDSEIPITINIPSYTSWKASGTKVSLNVAIVKHAIKKPTGISIAAVIASTKKVFPYS